ncbi:MAG TPA: EutN/CcmL family microcompartment protein [candidate division Zixibacteria bacterium]
MFIGTVIGQLWSTKKVANLQSLRFLLVRPQGLNRAPNTDVVVAADVLGAGVGEKVMVAYGRAARLAVGDENCSIEAAVVGIIDNIDARGPDDTAPT